MIALWILLHDIVLAILTAICSLCIASVRQYATIPGQERFQSLNLNIFFPIDERPQRRAVIFLATYKYPTKGHRKIECLSNVSLDRNIQE